MNVIVAGCGRVGSHLATLLSNEGHNVVVIDRRESAFKELGRDFNGQTVKGVAFDEDVLRSVGIEDCDVVAAVTSNDNANMLIASVAQELFGVKHVITRLYEPKREKTYLKLGIDFSCGTTLVAKDIFTKIHAGHGNHMGTIGNFEITQFFLDLGDEEATISVAKLEKEYDARVVVYEHDDETLLPSKGAVLQHGDFVFMCLDRDRIPELSKIVRM